LKVRARTSQHRRRLPSSPIYRESLPFKNDHKLNGHQVEELNWLMNSQSSILADEMRLAEMIQTLAMLEMLSCDSGVNGPFFIIAPLTTIPNWLHEIREWTDFHAEALIHTAESRNVIKQYLIYFHGEDCQLDKSRLIANIIVVSCKMVKIEVASLKESNYAYVIIGCQKIYSSTYKSISSVRGDQFLLMTGTPIENNVSELWLLLHFLLSDKFDDCDRFVAEFGSIQEVSGISRLHEVINVYLLRRKVSDVDVSIEPKEETIIEVQLPIVQRMLYRSVVDRNRKALLAKLSTQNQNLHHVF
jgi:chromodomain-helicase-DNA-binding protein 1